MGGAMTLHLENRSGGRWRGGVPNRLHHHLYRGGGGGGGGASGGQVVVEAGPLLMALAERVRRLSPCHRDPEQFHADKSEIEAELRRLARGARHG